MDNLSAMKINIQILHLLTIACALALPGSSAPAESSLPPLPEKARLVLDEDWSSGRIDPDRWYVLRKKWGQGNHGVVRDNVKIEKDPVGDRKMNVLVCEVHGDLYDGPVNGFDGKTRVGGVIVSKAFLASGRFEVVVKIGSENKSADGPTTPTRPIGAVPAIWTYGYRYVSVPPERKDDFHSPTPLFNPHMGVYGGEANEYWSEIDFPEFGKSGEFDQAMYNTFLQNRHDSRTFDVAPAIDGRYHTLTTEWRTELRPLDSVRDSQVIESEGYYWIQDKSIPFDQYFGNPLKRLDKDRYAVYAGKIATHWIDGKKVGENTKYVPAMAAQLNIGAWLPGWGGPAPWKVSRVSFASVRVWQYDDPGDARGIITDDIPSSDPDHSEEK